MSVNVKWCRPREIKSSRGRGSCRCENFVYRESRNIRLVRTWRSEGRVTKKDLANFGTIRSCCFVTNGERALESFLERVEHSVDELLEQGVVERGDLVKIQGELALGVSEYLPHAEASELRALRFMQRAKRARKRGDVLAPRKVAAWMPVPFGICVRHDNWHDAQEGVDVKRAETRDQEDAYQAQLVTVQHRYTEVLNDEQRTEISGLFRGPGFEGLNMELHGPLQDLLAAQLSRQFAEARLSLGVAAAAIRQRRTVEKIHASPLSGVAKRRAFKALANVMKGMVETFGDVWRDDLKFWKRANCYRIMQEFHQKAENNDTSKLTKKERRALSRVMSQYPDLQASFKASRKRSQREGLRDFLGLRRKTKSLSFESCGAADRVPSPQATPLDEAIAREMIEQLTDAEREVAALYLEAIQDGREITQSEVAAIAYPAKTPGAACREVSRACARIGPFLEEALEKRRAA